MRESQEIPQYSRVKILTDRFLVADGVGKGTLGYVIEIHRDGEELAYEIEVSEPDGETRALVVARAVELEIAE